MRLDEVYGRLGAEAREVFPGSSMHGTRNILVHRYPIVDYALVWDGLVRFAELDRLLADRMGLPRQ